MKRLKIWFGGKSCRGIYGKVISTPLNDHSCLVPEHSCLVPERSRGDQFEIMNLKFTKMHGAGNDFVFLNNISGDIPINAELAKKLCHRRFGAGADQLLVVLPSSEADFRMDIYNADGGKVEMCGNGIRCFTKYVWDKKLTTKTELAVDTLETLWVKVDMGKPVLEGRDIPVGADGLILSKALKVEKEEYRITCVSMGNPHCVVFVSDVDLFPVETMGPKFEDHIFFPNRINVEFIQVIDRKNIKMRVWERGSGETLACGTGACAATVASILNSKVERNIKVHLRGGVLEIFWDEDDDRVWMTGPATTVFEGEINM